jgi:hypothetical protein
MTFDEWAKKWGVPPVGAVGDGWVGILEDLATKLAAKGFDFSTVAQIKEKYGGLRFYYDGCGFDAEVDAAEEASYETCEECGAPGEARKGGWIKTLCNECEAERRRGYK